MSKVRSIAVNICRFILAATFIFSGYVKAIDPLGTQYKLQDYAEAAGLAVVAPDWLTLCLSVMLSALEFCLGIFLLFALHRRQTSRITLVFMAVMTLITLWLVIANPIEDCGCFGDALKLTNGQTFAKNIVLLLCALVVAWQPLRMVRFISEPNQWIGVNYSIIFIVLSSLWSLYTLPPFDFRPYHVGASIREGMEIPDDAPQPKFETTFIMEKNGQQQEFSLENYPDSTWTFVDSKTVEIEKGYVPPIHDFSVVLMADQQDLTDQILSNPGHTLLLIAPHLQKADDTNFGEINQIHDYAVEHDIPFYCLTASTDKAIARWVDLTGAEYPFCTTDETTLKTIIRSNPGLVLLHDGAVAGKWSHNQLPTTEELLSPSEISTTNKIIAILLWFALPLLLLTLADRTWAWTKWLRKSRKT
ncbi:MAG: DoxX family protein [Prevotella sp.]|nr:DoxX family protein [Prevotella sp.]